MFEISRRDLVLSAAGAYAAFGLPRPIAFIGAAHAQKTPNRGFLKYRVGDIEVTSLGDGIAEVPHREDFISNASVDQTKAALRAAGLSDARMPFAYTVIAAKAGDRLVLIDTGTGGLPVFGPKVGLLAQSMAAAGLKRKAVTTVVISHLHGDHIFGLMDRNTNAQLFPQAEIIVPAAELKWWTQPGRRPQGLARRIQATLATWKNVRAVDGEAELVPGLYAVRAPGHSVGHTAHLLSSQGKQLLATADVSMIPALSLKNPDWQVVLDQDPVLAVETRKKIFDRAITDKAMVAGSHWGLPNIGTIAKDGNGYAFIPAA